MKVRTILNLIFLSLGTTMFVYPVYAFWVWIVLVVVWVTADTVLIRSYLTKRQLLTRLWVTISFILIMSLMTCKKVNDGWIWLLFVVIWFVVDYLSLSFTGRKGRE